MLMWLRVVLALMLFIGWGLVKIVYQSGEDDASVCIYDDNGANGEGSDDANVVGGIDAFVHDVDDGS